HEPVAAEGSGPRWPAAGIAWFVAAVLLAVVVAAGRLEMLLSETLSYDEGRHYLKAVMAVKAGEPLSTVPTWLYPPAAAHLMAWYSDVAGTHGLFVTLRLLNAAGMVAVMSCAGASLADVFPRRSEKLVFSPLISVALYWQFGDWAFQIWSMGNISGLLFIPMLCALHSRSAILRIVSLASGFLFKPYALGHALARPWREAVLPVLFCAAMIAVTHRDPDWVASMIRHPMNMSPWHFLVGVLGLPHWAVFGAFVLIGATWARGSAGRALCVGWAILPVAWPHTSVILLLPWAWAMRALLLEPDRPRPRRGAALLIASLFLLSSNLNTWAVFQLLDHEIRGRTLLLLQSLLPTVGATFIALRTEDPAWLFGGTRGGRARR
ncbi:MAG: hypothetical protein VX265_16845, partial [Myxococcota bacterium]|nr:hypothetical protein [Myxococcota bacterium]